MRDGIQPTFLCRIRLRVDTRLADAVVLVRGCNSRARCGIPLCAGGPRSQQKGALNLPTISLADPTSLVRHAGQTTWLLGTLALFTGYLFQAGALDRGRLSIIEPLLVTTVVFALPLGYFLTKQHRGRSWSAEAAPFSLASSSSTRFGRDASPGR